MNNGSSFFQHLNRMKIFGIWIERKSTFLKIVTKKNLVISNCNFENHTRQKCHLNKENLIPADQFYSQDKVLQLWSWSLFLHSQMPITSYFRQAGIPVRKAYYQLYLVGNTTECILLCKFELWFVWQECDILAELMLAELKKRLE